MRTLNELITTALLFTVCSIRLSSAQLNCTTYDNSFPSAYQIIPGLKLSWSNDVQESKIVLKLTFVGHPAWLAVGPSRTGLMIGSEAYVGVPSLNTVKLALMTLESAAGVNDYPDSKQTTTDASISTSATGSELKFTINLPSPEDTIGIKSTGPNILVRASRGFTDCS
jgi:hypothetical protein